MATTLDRGLEHDQPVQLQIAGARRRGPLDRVLLYLALIVIALFFVFPLIVVVSASLKYRAEVFTGRRGSSRPIRASRTTRRCSRVRPASACGSATARSSASWAPPSR